MTKIIINDSDELEEKHYTEYDDLYKNFKDYEVDAFIAGDKYLFIYNNRLVKSKVTEFLLKQILEFTVPILDDYPQFLIKNNSIRREHNILSLQINNTILATINGHNINIPTNNEFTIKGLKFYKKFIMSNNFQNKLSYDFQPLIKLNMSIDTIHLDSSMTYDTLSKLYNYITYYLKFYEYHGRFLLNYYPSIPQPIKPIDYSPIKLYKDNVVVKKILDYIDENSLIYYNDAVYEKFKSLDLHVIYENINLYGLNISKFDDFKSQKIESSNLLNNNKDVLQSITKYYKLRSICKNKFPNLFNPGHKDYIFNEIEFFSMSKLSKKQVDEVLLEYEKSESYLQSFILNTCSHIQVLNEFRNSKQSFEDLKNYIDYYPVSKGKQFSDEYMKCKLCKFDIICPHLYEYYTKLSGIENDKEEYALKQYIIKNYASNNQVNYTYTCKICSEEIGKSADLEQFASFAKNVKLNNSVDVDPLKIQIIKLSYQIVINNIDFGNVMIDNKVLVFNIVDLSYSYVKAINVKLSKSKTTSAEEITQKIYVYSTIVIIACCVNIMNLSDIKFKSKTGGKMNNQAIKLKHNMIAGFNIITSMQKYYINKLNISGNEIKNMLLQFYKKIATVISPIEINESKIPVLDLLKISSVYNYVINFNNSYPIITNKYNYTDYKILLNKDITKTSGENIYNNLRMPQFSLNKQRVDHINSKKEYLYSSGIHLFKYLMMNIFKYTPYESQYDKGYTKSVIDDITEYKKITNHLLTYETRLIEENSKKILLPYAKVSFTANRFYTPAVKNMNVFWDDNGNTHKFNKDKECTICKQSYNSIKSLSQDACKKKNAIITEKLIEKNNINSFFRYFTFKCPIELFHSFKNNKCEYCDVTQDQLTTLDTTYYNKFLKGYKDILKAKQDIKQNIIDDLIKSNDGIDYFKNYEDTDLSLSLSDEINEDKLNLLAFSFDIKPELLKNLGVIPSDSKESSYYKLYNYFSIVIILYNLLRYNKNIVKFIDQDFKKFIDSFKANNVDLSIFSNLPALPILQSNIDYNRIVLDKNINNIILNSICTNILFITEQNKNVRQVKEFAKFVLDKILKYDKLFQPYDRFKKDLVVEKRIDDVNIQETFQQFQNVNEDEYDIFSNQAFDFDMDEDEDNLNGEYQ